MVLQDMNNNRRLVRALLLAILLIALILRLSLLFWGFPYVDKFSNYFHSDEWILKTAIYDFPHDIVERTQLNYPTGYQYLLAVIVLPVKLMYLADDSLSRDERGLIDLIAKLTTILVSLATVVLVYKFGILLSKNKYIGLLGAALMAIVTVSVNNASFITTDTALAFFFTLFVYFVLKAFSSCERLSNKRVILFGVMFGYCTATKYNGAMAIILLPWLLYDYIKKRDWQAAGRMVGLFVMSSIVTFFVATPSALIHPKAFIYSVCFVSDWNKFSSKPGDYSQFLLSYAQAFNLAIGILCAAALIYYMVVIVYLLIMRLLGKSRVDYDQSAKLVIPVVLLILLFSWYFRLWLMDRYFLMVVPIWILIGVMFWFNWWNKSPTTAMLCIILVVFFSLQSITVNWLYHIKDNRRMASKYILSSHLTGTAVNHRGQFRPSLLGTRLKLTNDPNPDYLIVSTPKFSQLIELLEQPFESPQGPGYGLKFRVQYPRSKELYDLLVDAIIQKKSYTLLKKFEIENSWVRKFMVATLWEPEIHIYKRVKE
jgi:hypothetical protein